jgi:nicotinamidase-related amidase
VFVGLQTDYCVRASILGAIASGFKASKITLLRGAHSTYDNTSSGKSYQQVKEDVEKRLADVGVILQDWIEFAL